jgi:predicted ATPase
VTVLATSREALGLAGEQRYQVAPLALPLDAGDAEALARVPAVALFCERAQLHDPGFRLGEANAAAVAEICRRVDGLPLAIELAAARCGLLSPSEISERLDTALGALGAGTRDAPARQRTLRATIGWGHDLLSDAERECFARFAVFAGGATVEAAETILGAGIDTLDHLVAKSLLVRRQHARAPTRLGMLETIRADATERPRHRRRQASGLPAPLPLLPDAGAAPRKRPGSHERGAPGAPRRARRRHRQPSRRSPLGDLPT